MMFKHNKAMTSQIPLLAVSDRQNMYSMAYVEAIIATAGFNVSTLGLDRKSIDIGIEFPDPYEQRPKYFRLGIQLKCTYAHSVNTDKKIHYPLPVRNYNQLRESFEPKILVVVLVPRVDGIPQIPWIECQNDDTIFRHRAYWASLHGEPPTTNTETVTVKVPIDNSFDVKTVEQLMNIMVFLGNKNP